MYKLLPLALSVMLTACAVGPDYQAPQSVPLASYSQADAAAEQQASEQRFWSGFNDPQLAALVDRALAQNLDVQTLLARYQGAEALLRGARRDRWPSVTLQGSAGEQRLAEVERSACPTCGSCSGMFTANSMNCLTEALGLALPGNGTVLATHADRRRLFENAGHRIVELAKRYYEGEEAHLLPRAIGSKAAFKNAMTLDIAMGGSTNTVLHLLAAAQEGEVDFTMADIDRLSRRVPVLCKVAPAVANVHMEDVHRAGGIMAILGELNRAGLIDASCGCVHAESMEAALGHWDVTQTSSRSVHDFYRAAPGGVPTQVAFSQSERWEELDTDREQGVIRSAEHAFSKDGGLAVLFGNLAPEGCIVKTAGVDESILVFHGTARVYESQDAAIEPSSSSPTSTSCASCAARGGACTLFPFWRYEAHLIGARELRS